MRAQIISENLEFTRGKDSKKALGVGILRDIVKPDNLNLPLTYNHGSVVDSNDNIVLRANRMGDSPLLPYERDDLMKITVKLLNWSFGSPEQVQESYNNFKRGKNSKKSLEIGEGRKIYKYNPNIPSGYYLATILRSNHKLYYKVIYIKSEDPSKKPAVIKFKNSDWTTKIPERFSADIASFGGLEFFFEYSNIYWIQKIEVEKNKNKKYLLIKENNFERGQSSKSALNLGLLQNLPKKLNFFLFPFKYQRNGNSSQILDDNDDLLISSMGSNWIHLFHEQERLYKTIVSLLNFYYSDNGILKESLNFERGIESKKSLGVGRSYIDNKIFENIPEELLDDWRDTNYSERGIITNWNKDLGVFTVYRIPFSTFSSSELEGYEIGEFTIDELISELEAFDQGLNYKYNPNTYQWDEL